MKGKNVLWEENGAIGTVVLNRPTARNGVTAAMVIELHDILQFAATRKDIAVIVLRGAGGDFCVGGDIDEAVKGDVGAHRYEDLAERYHSSTLLHEMPQVTVAVIDGGCAGAGFGWAAACDLRFASTRAVFSTAFLKVGASGDMGLIWHLNRLLGSARARELFFLGDRLTADDALSLGLVSRLFDPIELHDGVSEIAHRLAASPLLTLRMAKANFVSADTLPLDQYIDIESARLFHVASSPAMREGFAKFLAARRR